MGRSKSSHIWMQRHVNDEYVQRAQKEGYRSRASYKLLEIQEKDRILKPGQVVVDLGAAPGGWSQVAAAIVGDQGKVLAMDILDMDGIPGVEFLQGDFREQEVMNQLINLLEGRSVDLVVSDIAPNASGVRAVDQPRAMYLAELALDFARTTLKSGGSFVTKLFQGEGFDDYIRDARSSFNRVVTRKPKSSRAKSREVYMVATDYKS
ncbi:23S rRNA (uridine(2552)-2'-O)-methyltransferase RlmE [Thiolapillus brandeum]|uniref:Ribosomal RNA large subunit methyltransferase E n=1 Tax=Thiolapillus brandeum TaxID=1076588 RepID=A0A7U6GJC0_9GAMM|nr:23S rRNA (uridine(2552)-2'-O)-methyltransferase RlmE [Thiolapillus brandeum]BAO44630.1 cell division protein FtsJ [Thiolapillus brandeum]